VAKPVAAGGNAISAAARTAGKFISSAQQQARDGMIAVHLESGGVSIRKTDVPNRPSGYALLRTRLAGICNTDLELQRGYYGFAGTPGHEFVAEVADADTRSLVGKRVVGEINLACGRCEFCAQGLGRHCANRTVLGIVKHPGAFAQYFTLPEANLHILPDSIPDEEAVFVEPLAAACELLDQVAITRGEQVAVLGGGKLGLLIARVLTAHGADVAVFGRHTFKPHGAFKFVVDATGSAIGLKEAVMMVQPRGTVIMKSTIHGDIAIDTATIIVNEITLVGSRCGRFEPAIELLKNRQVDVRPMISANFPLEQADEAFTLAAKPGVLKVLLSPE
jgi:threonine dehydrogenase-like Zn-dependent dehydrogenase